MKQFFVIVLMMTMSFISEKAFSTPNVKYDMFTYDPQHPHLNPFKKIGAGGITWADHMVNVNTDRLSYMDPIIGHKWTYLGEAAYCMNVNDNNMAIGASGPFNATQAQWVLERGTPVIRNIPAGQLLVLGVNPATGKLGCFLNPEYREVAMIEYTAPNGVSIYVSKYSGEGKECCINLCIDLAPRHATVSPTVTVVRDAPNTTINNYYYNSTSYSNVEYYNPTTFMWEPLWRPIAFNACICPMGCGMSMYLGFCGESPRCRYRQGGCTYEVYQVTNNVTNIVNNYNITANNPPQVPPSRPGTNTGGGGSTGTNTGGGGGNQNTGGSGLALHAPGAGVNSVGNGNGSQNGGGSGAKMMPATNATTTVQQVQTSHLHEQVPVEYENARTAVTRSTTVASTVPEHSYTASEPIHQSTTPAQHYSNAQTQHQYTAPAQHYNNAQMQPERQYTAPAHTSTFTSHAQATPSRGNVPGGHR